MYAYIYEYAYIHTYIHENLHLHEPSSYTYIYIKMCIPTYMNMHIYTHIYTSINTYIHINLHLSEPSSLPVTIARNRAKMPKHDISVSTVSLSTNEHSRLIRSQLYIYVYICTYNHKCIRIYI